MEELIIYNSEGNLTGSSSSNQDTHDSVANLGIVPYQRQKDGGDDKVLHVYGHVPRDIDTVAYSCKVKFHKSLVEVNQAILTRAIVVIGKIIDVEKVHPGPSLTFIHESLHLMRLRPSG